MDIVQRIKEKMTKENVNNNKTEKRNQDGGKHTCWKTKCDDARYDKRK